MNNILLIEDEEPLRDVYKEVLVDSGYKVDVAFDGSSGLSKALAGVWDLLLLDIMLPGDDGFHILRLVKENEILEKRPVILLTNLGSEPIIKAAFSLGADGFLIKSEITPDKVVEEVTNYLGRKVS